MTCSRGVCVAAALAIAQAVWPGQVAASAIVLPVDESTAAWSIQAPVFLNDFIASTAVAGPHDTVAPDDLAYASQSAVPEPATLTLVGTAALLAVRQLRKRRRLAK